MEQNIIPGGEQSVTEPIIQEPEQNPAPAFVEPTNISEAFNMSVLAATKNNELDKPDDNGSGQSGGAAGEAGGLADNTPPVTGEGATAAQVTPSADPTASAASDITQTLETVDYTGFRAETNKHIVKLAQNEIRTRMRENNIQPIIPANLKATDERGNVYWNNPDNPNRPFQTRAEAQDWCNDRDAEIKQVIGQEMRKLVGEYAKVYEPYIKMHEFVPTYNTMNKAELALFEPMIEQYEILDPDGDVIGYKCDLNQMLSTVRTQLSHINATATTNKTAATAQAAQALAPAAPPAGPSLAMGGSTATAPTQVSAASEPKDINEAMAMIMAKRNAELKGNK